MVAQDDLLRAAILRAQARWSTGVAERFPPASEWEPLAGSVGTEKFKLNQSLETAVPTVPTVPTEYGDVDDASPPLTAEQEERAAILEFDAGLSRPEAEHLARMSAAAF